MSEQPQKNALSWKQRPFRSNGNVQSFIISVTIVWITSLESFLGRSIFNAGLPPLQSYKFIRLGFKGRLGEQTTQKGTWVLGWVSGGRLDGEWNISWNISFRPTLHSWSLLQPR